jgi:hypothetical protein
MSEFFKHIPYWICLGLCVYIFFLREVPAVNNYETHNHYSAYDSTKRGLQIKEIPGPVKTITVEVPQKVDTAKILQDYYSLQIYRQTIGDSLFRATITDTLQHNRLKGRGFEYQILRPTAVLQAPKQNKVFLGVTAGVSKSGLKLFGPAATLVTKNDHLYSAGYNLMDNSFTAGIGWKIGRK